MTEYRIYTVGMDGHFIRFDPLICLDDGEAVQEARRMLDGHDLELWNAERFVIRLERKQE